jgi:F0F1-type ATP synthase membrane subunit b/b'
MDQKKEIRGHQFKIVDKGLDEAEVYSFIDSLTNQYGNFINKLENLDTLVNRLVQNYNTLSKKLGYESDPSLEKGTSGHSTGYMKPSANGNSHDIDGEKLENLDTLTKFAERTVIEAAKHAKSIISEAEEKAEIEASRIISSAQEHATTERQRNIIDADSKIPATGQQNTQEPAQTIQNDKEAVISPSESKIHSIVEQVKEKVEENAQVITEESERLLSKGQKVAAEDIKDVLDNLHQSLLGILEVISPKPSQPEPTDNKTPETTETEEHESPQTDTPDNELQEQAEPDQVAASVGDSDLFDGTIELVLPPPVVLDRMLQLHKHLKQIPHVDVLNLGGSVDKGITIRILADSPVPLVKAIGDFDEVTELKEELPNDACPISKSDR